MSAQIEKTLFRKMLLRFMNEQDLSQLQLAVSLGIRQSQISNWLNEKTLPTYSSIKLLKDYFNVSADAFFEVGYDR